MKELIVNNENILPSKWDHQGKKKLIQPNATFQIEA